MNIKRYFDIVVPFIFVLIFFPLFLLIAILIKFSSAGPVFFFQNRIGFGGKPFIIIKFRSMQTSDEIPAINTVQNNRISPIGKFLRKTKLDELPQLFNILKGEMSFVGPRPDVPGYADKLQGDDRLILSVRPGLTGAASLIYNNEEVLLSKQKDPQYFNDHILYPDKVRIDCAYIRHQSFWLDLKIILFTLLGKRLTEDWAQPAIKTT